MKHVWAMHARTCMCLSVCAHIDFRPGLHFYNKRLSMKVNLTNTSVWFMHTHTHHYLRVCVCVCVCRCESMGHTMRCTYVCMCKWHLCVHKHTYIINWVRCCRCCCCQTQHTATHNTQPIATQHNTTQHNTTKQNAQQRDPIRSPFDTSAWNESWLITGFPFELYLQKFAATAHVQRRRLWQRQRQPMADCRPTTDHRHDRGPSVAVIARLIG